MHTLILSANLVPILVKESFWNSVQNMAVWLTSTEKMTPGPLGNVAEIIKP